MNHVVASVLLLCGSRRLPAIALAVAAEAGVQTRVLARPWPGFMSSRVLPGGGGSLTRFSGTLA